MTALWKEQLQEILELSRKRIERLEADTPPDARSLDSETNRQIETEAKNISRLQRTIDALI
ncbi:hypothetical protein GCM10010987_77110 [Bradyrhizobium guangdongense]|uniref:Uncharacterized protein n=1 Tax=Bradyrhizobium guangdongense TaxID=1325090 RepID=A0A410V3L2_9BRAD|nr:hypothetical protein X265_11565 [Bradyrhizobium guangdongense]QOZ59305.1 hypothetical protein XH86_11560 [Bradyrhizobium guangdongense]GGI33974.1 hypothetical protein GCM10010987_77110 [Bradyrhizobium guangdongense]